MSKSTGVVANPNALIDALGPDMARYALMRQSWLETDAGTLPEGGAQF
jgi:methionyl-tRNA synthetase